MTIQLLETNNAGEVVECGTLDGPSFESKLTKKAWPDVILLEARDILDGPSRFFALEDFDASSARYMRVGGIVI